MEPKLFTANVVKWFDKTYGNTYHSVRIIRHRDGAVLTCQFQYGYGEQYKYTALSAMAVARWLPPCYAEPMAHGGINCLAYERENGYPIIWNVHNGLKRECVANGKG